MAQHKLTVTITPELIAEAHDNGTVAEDAIISSAASVIHGQYVDEGKITDMTESDNGDGTYQLEVTFVDSATCDTYLAEMQTINEFETSGASRSNQTRADV